MSEWGEAEHPRTRNGEFSTKLLIASGDVDLTPSAAPATSSAETADIHYRHAEIEGRATTDGATEMYEMASHSDFWSLPDDTQRRYATSEFAVVRDAVVRNQAASTELIAFIADNDTNKVIAGNARSELARRATSRTPVDSSKF